ncbi:hypothetical protein CPB86DRAFT_763810 [Serendipita vermifera]|nr:hypothetical protein CPB86DRAFT_763810 [Serendipita vermifera]
MDVDGQSTFINIQDDQPKPIQRSRRTYGSKPKALNEHENNESTSDNLSSSNFPVSSHQSLSQSTSLPSHNLRLGEWRKMMKEIDQDESEEDETSDQRRARRELLCFDKTHESEVQSTGSSPPSYLSELQDEPGSPSQQTHPKLISENAGRQHSANTSFNSGSSAAISTPSPTGEQLKGRPKLSLYGSRPLPPAHRDSNLTDEEEDDEEPLSPLRAILGRSEAPSRSPKVSGARSTTPGRALPTSSFRSPLKSFTDATRRERKFVQRDSDEEMDDRHDLIKDLGLKPQQEDELGWVTDGSVEGKGSKKDGTKSKIKKPTKKEILETEKESARIRAAQDLNVQDRAEYQPKTFAEHFQKRLEHRIQFSGRELGNIPPAPLPLPKPTWKLQDESDPITAFSSSPNPISAQSHKARNPAQLDLLRKKQEVVRHLSGRSDSEESEIEIVADTPIGTKTMNPIDKLEYARQKKKSNQVLGHKSTSQTAGPSIAKREVTKEMHNRMLRERAAQQSVTIMAEKKADFLQRGGLLTKEQRVVKQQTGDLLPLLTKASSTNNTDTQPIGEDEDEDYEGGAYHPSDEDQTAQTASSPNQFKPTVLAPDSSVSIEALEGHMDFMDEENDRNVTLDRIASVTSDASDADTEDEIAPRKSRQRPAVIQSDDEDESTQLSEGENVPPRTASNFSRSSMASTIDVFASSSKPATLSLSTPRVPFGELGRTSSGSTQPSPITFSPSQQFSLAQRKLTVSIASSSESSPRKEKSTLLPAFGDSSPNKPIFKSSSPFAFSTIFADRNDKETTLARSTTSSVDFKPAKFGDISTQLFLTQSSPSQRASPSKRERLSSGGGDPLDNLRPDKDDDDFLFTQPGQLGRIDLSTQELKEVQRIDQVDAEAVLKDQEEERQARIKAAQGDEEPRWINKDGLFTQTRPEDPAWSLSQSFSQPPSQAFTPLSLFPGRSDYNAEALLNSRSPAKSPPRRRLLRKGELATTAQVQVSDASERSRSPSPEKQINAFHHLMSKKDKSKPLERNEFVLGEAEESDEDGLIKGFARSHEPDDDEENPADLEEVTKLLDDKKLTTEEIAENAVLEKHQEHLAADDAENQRIQEMAIRGQLRKKRGYGMMDDESSDDEQRARGVKYKKRRVEGMDYLDEIERNTQTRPFFEAYQRDLPGASGDREEHDEFAHLNQIVDEVDADADAESDAHSDSEMEEHSEEEVLGQTYTHGDLRREIQERRDRGDDLIYADDLQDAEDFVNQHMASSDAPMPGDYDHIEEVPVVKRRGTQSQSKDLNLPLPQSRRRFDLGTEDQHKNLAAWAKQNEKSRDTAFRGAGTAVTGHAKAVPNTKSQEPKSKTAAGNRISQRSETSSSLTSALSKKKDQRWD